MAGQINHHISPPASCYQNGDRSAPPIRKDNENNREREATKNTLTSAILHKSLYLVFDYENEKYYVSTPQRDLFPVDEIRSQFPHDAIINEALDQLSLDVLDKTSKPAPLVQQDVLRHLLHEAITTQALSIKMINLRLCVVIPQGGILLSQACDLFKDDDEIMNALKKLEPIVGQYITSKR